MSSTEPSPSSPTAPSGLECSAVNLGPNILRKPIIITSQSDADKLSGCLEIFGDILLQGDSLTIITLNSVRTIYGSLTAESCSQLSKISAPALQSIESTFSLSDLPALTELEFPVLGNVVFSRRLKNLNWDALPRLENLVFNSSVYADNITISNTGLARIDFLSFRGYIGGQSYTDTVRIINNPLLNKVDLRNITGIKLLEITNNGRFLNIDLPALVLAGTVIFGNAVNISVPSLSRVSNSLLLSDNKSGVFSAPDLTQIGYQTETQGNLTVSGNWWVDFSAPQLQTVRGSLRVQDNPKLQTLFLPRLNRLGYAADNQLNVSNNSAMYSVYLPDLRVITYASVTGNFSRVEIPNLIIMDHGINISTTNPILDCSYFDELSAKERSGLTSTDYNYSCTAIPPGTNKDVAKHYKAPSKGVSQSVKIGMGVFAAVAGCVLILFFLGLLGRREQKKAAIVEQEELDSLPVDPNEPPRYSRVARPGEVPPVYEERSPTQAETGAESRTDGSAALPLHQESGAGESQVVRRSSGEQEAGHQTAPVVIQPLAAAQN